MKLSDNLMVAIATAISFFGCASSKEQLLKMDESQVKLRSMQTRAFDTTDKNKMLGTVISALQDLGYIVNEVSEVIGMVSAHKNDVRYDKLLGKLAAPKIYPLRLTVTVRPGGETQLLVRANAEYRQEAVEDPTVYQNFFTVLERSVFLTASETD